LHLVTTQWLSSNGAAIDIMATIKPGDAKRYGGRLLCDKENGEGLDLVVEPSAGSFKLGSTTVPFEVKRGEDI